MLKLNHRSPETVLFRETPNIPRICRVIYVPRQKWFQQIAIRTPHTFCPRPNWPGQHLSAIIKFITSVRLFSGCLKWRDTQFARTAIFWQSEAAAQIDTHLGSWGRFSWSQVKWVRKPDCFSTGGEMRRMFEMCRVQVEGKWCSRWWKREAGISRDPSDRRWSRDWSRYLASATAADHPPYCTESRAGCSGCLLKPPQPLPSSSRVWPTHDRLFHETFLLSSLGGTIPTSDGRLSTKRPTQDGDLSHIHHRHSRFDNQQTGWRWTDEDESVFLWLDIFTKVSNEIDETRMKLCKVGDFSLFQTIQYSGIVWVNILPQYWWPKKIWSYKKHMISNGINCYICNMNTQKKISYLYKEKHKNILNKQNIQRES